MKLLGAIEKAGWENVYYKDTDSLFVNEIGKKNLSSIIDKNELGKMKDEESDYDIYGMMIRGPKDYTYYKSDRKLGISIKTDKIKGVPKNAKKIHQNEYEMFRFDKINTAIHNGNMHEIEQKKMVKILKRNYEKGIVLDDGTVTPLVMEG
jgi:hypothetical protein